MVNTIFFNAKYDKSVSRTFARRSVGAHLLKRFSEFGMVNSVFERPRAVRTRPDKMMAVEGQR